jgi:hypothetical protein
MQQNRVNNGVLSPHKLPEDDMAVNDISRQGRTESGLIKVKIDEVIFAVLRRKKRRGESVRMALERAIMELK